MRAQPRQQHAQPKRLGHIIVGARIEAEDGVGIAVRPGQHDDRHLHPGAAQQSAQFPPVHVGQPDIEQNGVEAARCRRARSARAAVSHSMLANSSFSSSCSASDWRNAPSSSTINILRPALIVSRADSGTRMRDLIIRQIRAPHPRRGLDVTRIAPLLPVAPGSRDGRSAAIDRGLLPIVPSLAANPAGGRRRRATLRPAARPAPALRSPAAAPAPARPRRPGGTSNPACGGTVSGIAPAVVAMIGRPCAIASAKAMP